MWLLRRAIMIATRVLPPCRGITHTLPGKLVLSVASYPPRFPTLDLALRVLLAQDMAPDTVVLWVAAGDIALLPKRVRSLERYGLLIRACEPNMKSANKLVHALKEWPDAYVLTADDDVCYPRSWLRRFVEEYRFPNEILCQRARRIPPTLDRYDRWPLIGGSEAGASVFPTGRGGVLYPPGTLSPEVGDDAAFLTLCPHADDVWFYWMARRAGSWHRVIASNGALFTWPGSQGTKLWAANKGGGNDAQIAAMINRYGIPA